MFSYLELNAEFLSILYAYFFNKFKSLKLATPEVFHSNLNFDACGSFAREQFSGLEYFREPGTRWRGLHGGSVGQ